eukprot:4056940-Amphidinium_carterae.2
MRMTNRPLVWQAASLGVATKTCSGKPTSVQGEDQPTSEEQGWAALVKLVNIDLWLLCDNAWHATAAAQHLCLLAAFLPVPGADTTGRFGSYDARNW